LDKLLLTVGETAQLLSLGRTKVYELIADGTLGPKISVGRAVRLRSIDVQAFVERKAKERAASA